MNTFDQSSDAHQTWMDDNHTTDDATNRTANACVAYIVSNPDLASSIVSRVIFGVLYSVTFFFGLIGNVTMLCVTLCNRSMITVQNILIMNLAVSDIMICLLCIPITPILLIYKEWYFGRALCHVIMWVQGSGIFITTYTLMAIALDRYILVTRPHVRLLTIKVSLGIIAAIWICAGVLILPYAYYMKIVTYDGICGEFCDEAWPSVTFQRTFTGTVLVLQYILPFIIISGCYTTIFKRLALHVRDKLDRLSWRQMERVELNRRKRRSTIVLLCMVLIFGTCWLPYNAISMIGNYVDNIFSNHVYFLYLVAHCFAMLSIPLNPILYAWLNSAFRTSIIRMGASVRQRLTNWGDCNSVDNAQNLPRLSAFGGVAPELCTDYLIRHRRSSNLDSRNSSARRFTRSGRLSNEFATHL